MIGLPGDLKKTAGRADIELGAISFTLDAATPPVATECNQLHPVTTIKEIQNALWDISNQMRVRESHRARLYVTHGCPAKDAGFYNRAEPLDQSCLVMCPRFSK